METLIPGAETARFLLERFGLPYRKGVLTPTARGSMGQIWRLDLTRPMESAPAPTLSLMVKQFFWGVGPDAEDVAATEVEFCDRAVEAGVSASRSCATVDGTYVQVLPPEMGGATVRVNSWVRGRHVRRDDADRADYLGRTLGLLHGLRHPTATEPDVYFTTPPTPQVWEAQLTRVIAERDRIPRIAQALPDRMQDLLELGSFVAPSVRQALICSHRDVKPENVLVDENSGEWVLIDWDEVGPINPQQELAAQLVTWHVRNGIVDRRAVAQTMRAYRGAGGWYGEVDSLAAFSWRLATDLNYVDGQATAALADDLGPEMRQHAEQEAEAFLAWLPTRTMLEQVIEAARI